MKSIADSNKYDLLSHHNIHFVPSLGIHHLPRRKRLAEGSIVVERDELTYVLRCAGSQFP